MGDFYELFFDDAEVAEPGARHRADQARQASGRRHPDVRRADPRRRRLSAEADRARPPRRRLRADRGPGRGEEARRQVGRPARRRPPGDAGHAHRGRAARRRRATTISPRSRGCAAPARTAAMPFGARLDRHLDRRVPRRRRATPSASAPTSRGSTRASCSSPTRSSPTRRLSPFWRGLAAAVTPLSPAYLRRGDRRRRGSPPISGSTTLDGFGAFSRAELAAAAAALAYVEKTQIGERPPLVAAGRGSRAATSC